MIRERVALVVIDVQQGLIEGHEGDWRGVLDNVHALGLQARAAGAPVVLVQHRGGHPDHPLHPEGPGWALHPSVGEQPTDITVVKRWSDAFQDTDLDEVLRAEHVSRLVLVGAQTEFCVDATARRALSLNYDVDLVSDGHTTSDNGLLTREQIIAHHNGVLANLAVVNVELRVVRTRDVRLSQGPIASEAGRSPSCSGDGHV